MKGLYSQGVVILTERPVSLDELFPLLLEYPVRKKIEAHGEWAFGGPTAVIAYREEINGMAAIDTVDHQWPDHMGDPMQNPVIFGAWSMGQFGPFAYPDGLSRAVQHSWSWSEAKTIVPQHSGFVRLRMSYVFGTNRDARCLPQDYDPRSELDFITGIVQCLLRHPAALCYFNPNGEVVRPAALVEKAVEYHRNLNIPPLELWSNVRLFKIDGSWTMMDTVGNSQLDVPDHEAVFPSGKFEPGVIDNFLRNASTYVASSGREIKNNDTMNGPGGINWQAIRFATPIANPPREVYCWVPVGTESLPETVTNRALAGMQTTPSRNSTKPWWKFWN